jgi:hypothetical protein
MTNPFEAELQRRRAARSATRTNEQRVAALELFAVSMDGHRLEQIRKLHPRIAQELERRHEANLEAKAKAWEERQAMAGHRGQGPNPHPGCSY